MNNENLPNRKPNRLSGFDYSQNRAYFVTICVKDRQWILWEDENTRVGVDDHVDPWMPKQHRLTFIGATVEKYIKGIHGIQKYVIMPNHIHMIIIIDNYTPNVAEGDNNGSTWSSTPTQVKTLSKIISTFKVLVTKELGFSIWQRSFHDHIIRNEKEYRGIWQYIENNPINWESDELFTK